tara:strand:- start:1368 stop:2255 length:888 start_codon:yes stop_codon:yes gene_type:complete
MIKLFWNTHNQIKPNKEDVDWEKKARIHQWGIYHKLNSDKWIYEILAKIEFKLIEDQKDIESEDTIIIVDSNIENKSALYNKLQLACSKIFLIHLGDEEGVKNLDIIYQNCDYVWRTFCSNRYFKNEKVSCLPIGYKTGTINEKIISRKYKWAFIGTPHKSSRHDLLYQFSNIKPSFFYKTKKFNEKIIEANEMSKILSSTQFIPCPNGFFHPETYRLYEALECECIPIVENAYKYYDRLFPNNPFLKFDKWKDAALLVRDWNDNQIRKKQEECKNWWNSYKKNLQETIAKKVNI